MSAVIIYCKKICCNIRRRFLIVHFMLILLTKSENTEPERIIGIVTDGNLELISDYFGKITLLSGNAENLITPVVSMINK